MIASAQPQRMQRLHDDMHDGRGWNLASSNPCQCCVHANDARSLPRVLEDSQKGIAKSSCERSHTNMCPKRSGLGCVRLCYESRDGEDRRSCKKQKHRTPRGSKRTREDSDIDYLLSTPWTSKRTRDEYDIKYLMTRCNESREEQMATSSHARPESPASLEQGLHTRLACAKTPPRECARG